MKLLLPLTRGRRSERGNPFADFKLAVRFAVAEPERPDWARRLLVDVDADQEAARSLAVPMASQEL
jgi:hypothetical protein